MNRILKAIVGAFLLPVAAIAQKQAEIRPGVKVTFPTTWAASDERFTGAIALVTPAGGSPEKALARIYITATQYPSHDDVVRELGKVKDEAPAAPELLQIGGWPGVQRSALATLPRREPEEGEVVGESPRTMRVTTAVAAGDLLVRMEGYLAPAADSRIAEEMKAIGRSLVSPTQPTPAVLQQDMLRLRDTLRVPAVRRGRAGAAGAGRAGAGASEPLDPPAVLANNGMGELEVAASSNGQNVVIAANSKITFSNNSGASFNLTSGGTGGVNGIPFGTRQDLSVTWGASGRFYISFIGVPAAPASSSLAFGTSTNNGQSFNFTGNAVVCTRAIGCNVDQPHIAADRVTTAPGDQLYAVYRNFGPLAGCGSGCGSNVGAITCSADGGTTWLLPPVVYDAGDDFPRVTVGQDGFVYVVYRNGTNLKLTKFNSCSNGLVQQPGFPVSIRSVVDPSCPLPGLDRCNGGNLISSHMVAVDDLNPRHLYIAFAANTSASNENVIVIDSSDGGLTWPRSVVVNSSTSARRFMPWVCTAGGAAMVSWYDRRAATAVTNDLTDYFAGSVVLQRGTLRAGPEVNLSGRPDPQCASGFPCGAEFDNLTTSCATQPQFGGRCRRTPPTSADSNNPCDLRPGFGVCPAGETCRGTGQGCPKYGDYNGNACAAGRAYFAWASATAPPGLPAVGGVSIFASTLQLPTLTIRKVVSPASDRGLFDLQIDGVTRARAVAGGGTSGAQVVSAGTHDVGEVGNGSTRTSAYRLAVSGDCNATTRNVTLTYSDNKTCTITNTRIATDACLDLCDARLEVCMDQSRESGTPTRAVCMSRFNSCVSACRAP